MKQKFYTSIPFTIAVFALLAAGCSSNGNTLERPAISQKTVEENGKVAGTETTSLPVKQINVASQSVNVELADNNAARAQGLSNRKELQDGNGMLFDFTNTNQTRPGFWMQDMLISIDMIWINNGKIISINNSVPVPTKDKPLDLYYPPSNITHVLEVPAGWSQRNGIKIGDEVKI